MPVNEEKDACPGVTVLEGTVNSLIQVIMVHTSHLPFTLAT